MEESQRKFIRLKAVQELVSLGKTRIYDMASNGNFPKPCKLGPPLKNPGGIDSRINFWIKSEIMNFLGAVKGDRKPLVTGNQAFNAVRIVEAGLKSLQTGKLIQL